MKRIVFALAALACACSGPAPKPEAPGTWAAADSPETTYVSYSNAEGVGLLNFNCESEQGSLRIDAFAILAKAWVKGDRATATLGGKTFDAETFAVGEGDDAFIVANVKLSDAVIAALRLPGVFGVTYKGATVTALAPAPAEPGTNASWSPSPVDLVPGCKWNMAGELGGDDDVGDASVDAQASGGDAGGDVDPSLMAGWTGVYKHRFRNGSVSGETAEAENILEIVEVAPGRAYVRADLSFFNGHQCGFTGVAALESTGLVYRAPANGASGAACVLSVTRSNDEKGVAAVALIDDQDQCRAAFCSAGGGFNGVSWKADSRRSIRYLDRLRASEPFAAALNEAGIEPVAPARAEASHAK
jgi:hypothetical protein